jgi:O-antigen/teichoic acid export membrane protein
MYTCERHLQLARVTLINLGTAVLGIIVMVFWAWKVPSVWALVAGGLSATVARVVLTYVALPGPNNWFRWDESAWQEVSHFGKWVFLTSLVTFLASRFDKLVFAKLIPWTMLGVYSIAMSLAALSVEVVIKLSASVAFPAFSRARERPRELAAVFDRIRLLLLLGGGAVLSMLILCGPSIISVLYDRRYEDAGWILQIASIGAWFQVLEASQGQMLLTLGKPKWRAIAFAAQFLALLLILPRAFLKWGFVGSLAAASVFEAVRYGIESYQVRKSGLKGWGGERLLTGVLLACGVAAIVIQRGPWLPGGRLLRGLMCLGVLAAVWSAVAAWYFRRKRAAV